MRVYAVKYIYIYMCMCVCVRVNVFVYLCLVCMLLVKKYSCQQNTMIPSGDGRPLPTRPISQAISCT